MTTEFDYKDLITWQNLDKLAESDAAIKDGTISMAGNKTWTGQTLLQAFTTAGTLAGFKVSHTDNTNAASHARLTIAVGGASGGDPFIHFDNGVVDWTIGTDNSDSDKFKISRASSLGTTDRFVIDNTLFGIGTANPKKVLTIVDASSSSTSIGSNPILWMGGGNASVNTLCEIGFTYGTSAAYSETYAPLTIGYQLKSGSGFTKGDFVVATRNATTDTQPTERFRITFEGNIVCGPAALATGATDGFLYIPACAGTPTGAPTAYTGMVAIVFDTTNNKFYVYDGSWLGGTAPGAWS